MDPTADDREPTLAEVLEEVRRIDVQARRLVAGVLSGGYASVFRGSGVEFDEVREYEAGDDPRSVDWNVTARMGRPFVKKYAEERERTVVFLLDLSASTTGGFGPWSTRQTAARVCAVLALSAVRNDDKVGLVAFSDGVDRYVPPKKGMGHALRIVRDALALPARGRTDLVPALEFATRALRRRAIVFVVSDFLAEGWGHPLDLCARRHDVIAVRLLVPELDLEGVGLSRVRDPETGVATVLDGSSARVRAAWAARTAAWSARTEEALSRAGVDRLDVPVPRAPGKDLIAGPIARFFRMREMRGTKR